MRRSEVVIDGTIVLFTMGIKRDSFAPEHSISVSVDTDGVELDQVFAVTFSGSSARVRIQTRLRKLSEQELTRLESTGYECKWADIFEKVETSPADALAKLTREQFVDLIVEEYGLPTEQAEEMYNNKHGLPYGTRKTTA